MAKKKLMNGINKAIAKGNKDLKNDKAKAKKKGPPRPAKVKGEKKEKIPYVYKKSAVLAKVLKENPDKILAVHDLRAEKKGYRLDLQPAWQLPTDSKEPQHFIQEEGLTDVLVAIREVEGCYCPKCQAGIKWNRPTTFTKQTKLRCKTSGGSIFMTEKQWDARPLEYVKVGEIVHHNCLRWVDHNKEDAVKINNLLGDKVFYVG